MARILFVMSFGGPNAAESALISLLEGDGHTVTTLGAGTSATTPWPTSPGDYDAAVASYASGGQLGDWAGFSALTEGVVLFAAPEFGLATSVNNGINQTAVNIVADTHPIAAGAGVSNGALTVYTSASPTPRLTGMAAGGVAIANYATEADPVIAAFEAGATLISGTAPGRRVYLALLRDTTVWNAAAQSLFLASVNWAANVAADTTAPTLSNASAQATGATTAEGSVDVDEASTVDSVLTTSATAPTAEQIQAGTDHADAAAAAADLDNETEGPGTVNFSYSGLTAGTQYWQHSTAEDAAGNKAEVVTAGPFTTAPAAADDLAVSAVSAGRNDLSWTDPESSGATSYTVQRAPDVAGEPGEWADLESGITTGLGGAMSYSDTGATEGSAYHYRVLGVNSGGSTASNVDGPVTTLSGPVVEITAPMGSSITVSAGAVLYFEATATDADDGDLSDSIEWTSSDTDDGYDGYLGTGASVVVDTTGWEEGSRTITATSEDSDGDQGSDSITLVVGEAAAPAGGYMRALSQVASLGGY